MAARQPAKKPRNGGCSQRSRGVRGSAGGPTRGTGAGLEHLDPRAGCRCVPALVEAHCAHVLPWTSRASTATSASEHAVAKSWGQWVSPFIFAGATGHFPVEVSCTWRCPPLCTDHLPRPRYSTVTMELEASGSSGEQSSGMYWRSSMWCAIRAPTWRRAAAGPGCQRQRRALGGKLDGGARPAPRPVGLPVGHALHRDLGAVQDDDPVDEADVEQGLGPTAADRPASSMLGARSTRRDIPARETSMSPPFRPVCGLMSTARCPHFPQSKAEVISNWLLGLFSAPAPKWSSAIAGSPSRSGERGARRSCVRPGAGAVDHEVPAGCLSRPRRGPVNLALGHC